MSKPTILLAERNDARRQQLQSLLLCQGFEVIEAYDSRSVFRALRHKRNLNLLIVNDSLDTTGDGVEVARLFRRENRNLSVILIVQNSSEDLAIAALRAGLNDYFKQPFSFAELTASIQRCLADSSFEQPCARPEATAAALVNGQCLIGEGPAMQEIKTYIGRVAATDSNVLITGETGTGKELVANLIHRNGHRQQKPYVCINCPAIPDNLLESELFGYEKGAFTGASSSQEGKMQFANGGTVFFDEIGDMSPYTQAKILRAIESREVQRLGAKKSIPVDVRVIAATNQDLEQLMAEGKFRKDLYFRLNVARIHLPPLRERKEDFSAILTHYIREFNHRCGREVEGFTDEALASLLRYDWPGNVRELKNLVEAIFVNLPPRSISFMNLPEQFRRRLKESEDLPQDERGRLLSVLFSTNWNMSKAADKLHWSRMTLYRKMGKYHIARGGNTAGDTATVEEKQL